MASSTECSKPGVAIVVEGLDGVGKSTLVQALAKRLDAVALRTPPDSMEPFRKKFTSGGPDSVERQESDDRSWAMI